MNPTIRTKDISGHRHIFNGRGLGVKYLLLFILVFIFSNNLFCQTGPGGVGDNNSNVLWLKSEDINLTDGDDINLWLDQSGNGNDVSQPNSIWRPVFKTSILNGYPAVRFNKTNGRIRKTGFASFPTTEITAIYVNKNTESSDGVLSYASTGSNNDFLLYNSNNLKFHRGSGINTGVNVNDDIFHIVNASWRGSNGDVQMWKDGTLAHTRANFKTGTSIVPNGCLAIAGEQDNIDASYQSSQAHFGDFTEVLVYNTFLNKAQQIIVSNYLAAKYQLPISNDYYAYQNTHAYDVAGIGREDASNEHTSAMSGGLLQIENPTGMTSNKEYLLFGHDNADITTAWVTTEAPHGGNNIQRMPREWRLDETGDVGNVDFIVDVASLPALPAGHTIYTLMIDSDGDFGSGATVYELTQISGTRYGVTGIDIADGEYIAMGAVRPTLEHTLVASAGFESTNATIEVSLNFITNSARTADYTTSDGSAFATQPDYTSVTAQTVTVPAGSSTATYTISIVDDVLFEPSETFIVTLSNPSTGLNIGANNSHTYTIQDTDSNRKIYFDIATSSTTESASPVVVDVSINITLTTNPVAVDYIITGGTATNGTDYILSNGTVVIPAGSLTSSFSITINDDLIDEDNETLEITLVNPTNCNLDGSIPLGGTGITVYTHTILDNDGSPSIQFTSPSANGVESISSVNIPLEMSAVSGLDVTVNYTLSGSAVGGDDYILSSGVVTFSAGVTSTSISATIVDDLIEELSETLVLTLSAPTNAVLGVNTVFTYTIDNDDTFGHLGPGGVGKAINNVLWTSSDNLPAAADGSNINTWLDQSGNGNDFLQANNTYSPRYYSNIVNGHPVVRFDKPNGRLVKNPFNNFPSSAITTIIVNKNNDSGDGMLSYATSANNNEYLLFHSASLTVFHGGQSQNTSVYTAGNTFRIIENTWNGSNGKNLMFLNGNQMSSTTLAPGTSIRNGGSLALAGEQDAVDGSYSTSQSHQGDFAEFILYNTVLNTARRIIVDNYLSAKYNIAINQDKYAYDAPGSYEHEVAGIGMYNTEQYHNDAQGTAIVRINNPSDLANNEYLIWGHDGVDAQHGTRLIPWTKNPVGVDNALHRTWRVDETGGVGTVSVHFDLAGLTIGDSNDLVLLIDQDDGDFENATVIPLSSYAGSMATFDNIDLDAGNWFTVGSLSANNVLPIELVRFEAEVYNQQVDLTWETATETNNDYFTIEKSIDGDYWNEVTTIGGAGNSTVAIQYKTTDLHPYAGTSYYRLKQTDYDGVFEYSDIKPIQYVHDKNPTVVIYPNPTEGVITIEGVTEELQHIRIFTLYGQEITKQISVVHWSENKIRMDLSRMKSGMYIIQTASTSHRLTKQ